MDTIKTKTYQFTVEDLPADLSVHGYVTEATDKAPNITITISTSEDRINMQIETARSLLKMLTDVVADLSDVQIPAQSK